MERKYLMKSDLSKIEEVYEKYKNMEESIMKWNSNKQVAQILQDLWTAVKESLGHKIDKKKRRII